MKPSLVTLSAACALAKSRPWAIRWYIPKACWATMVLLCVLMYLPNAYGENADVGDSTDSICMFEVSRTGVAPQIGSYGANPNCTTAESYPIGSCTKYENGTRTCGPVMKYPLGAGNLIIEMHPNHAICGAGMVLPMFPGEILWGRYFRIVLYGLGLAFCFLGIAIISDVFMASIEVITSKEKSVEIEEFGRKRVVKFLVWNETIANLTLMALGSSAPEILLAIIETIGTLEQPPKSGGLGPSTIVGSAAFNLMVITAVCISSIPDQEDGTKGKRYIKEVGVFAVTASFSILAYVWLYIVVSDDIVTLAESLITFALFPFLVWLSYSTEKGSFCGCRFVSKEKVGANGMLGYKVRPQAGRNAMVNRTLRGLFGEDGNSSALEDGKMDALVHELALEMMGEVKTSRLRYRINATRFLKGGKRIITKKSSKNKYISEISNETAATKDMDASTSVVNAEGKAVKRHFSKTSASHNKTKIMFGSCAYGVNEGAGSVDLQVIRTGFLDCNTLVQWETKDGVAIAGEDYIHSSGVIYFPAVSNGESNYGTEFRTISIPIIDDEVFEPDENFFVDLTSPPIDTCSKVLKRAKETREQQPPRSKKEGSRENVAAFENNSRRSSRNIGDEVSDVVAIKSGAPRPVTPNPYASIKFSEYEFGPYKKAEVIILNDDCPGEFSFSKKELVVRENTSKVDVIITRRNGCDGVVKVSYETVDGSAVRGVNYKRTCGTATFDHNEMEKVISIPLISALDEPMSAVQEEGDDKPAVHSATDGPNDAESESKKVDLSFSVSFSLPEHPGDGSEYGDFKMCHVKIAPDEKYEEIMNKIAQEMEMEMNRLSFDYSSWYIQFKNALSCEGEDDDSEPSGLDYTMHFLTIGWKVLFALVPPTHYFGGYLSFFVSLMFVGVLTSIVADLASIFGCLLGIPDSITAITFVALGTSLPDTFASRSAAANDPYADASVGNVTGSNSVNVFLGLGLPWTLATVYHIAVGYDGGVYRVMAGSLSFSVSVFCPCACLTIVLLCLRRMKFGAELGGEMTKASSLFLVFLWLVYVSLSSLESIGYM